jgi:hypothetical protein
MAESCLKKLRVQSSKLKLSVSRPRATIAGAAEGGGATFSGSCFTGEPASGLLQGASSAFLVRKTHLAKPSPEKIKAG